MNGHRSRFTSTHDGTDGKRVRVRAPHRSIDRGDTLAAVPGEDRPDVLVTVLRGYLRAATHETGSSR
jgi:hypothetical protein